MAVDSEPADPTARMSRLLWNSPALPAMNGTGVAAGPLGEPNRGHTPVVDVHVARLRYQHGSAAAQVITARGIRYRLDPA